MRLATETLCGWGRIRCVTTKVARPERSTSLAAVIADSKRIHAIGALRSYGDAALVSGGCGLRMERLDRLLSFDAQTGILEAQAGVPLHDILATMAPKGWMPPVLPGTGYTTVGGAIANDVHGKNHHERGTFGQHVESLELIGPDGVQRTVLPGTDIFKATLGGVGLTGVIASARIALMPCPAQNIDISETRIESLDAFMDAFDTAREPFQVGWIDALAQGAALGRGIFETADFASPQMPVRQLAPKRSLPVFTPGFLLSAHTVRAFNAAYFRRVSENGRRTIRPMAEFFFPLDAITNWNQLYGKRGFHQFQCVLPLDASREGLRRILTAVSDARIASPLAVIKKMGPGRAGHLSFAMSGMTLALDLPNHPRVSQLLSEIHRIVLDHGGRTYLAKDSALDRRTFSAMYEELDDFRVVAQKTNPYGKFGSLMSERLDLGGMA